VARSSWSMSWIIIQSELSILRPSSTSITDSHIACKPIAHWHQP
jgi:hypothetical protein